MLNALFVNFQFRTERIDFSDLLSCFVDLWSVAVLHWLFASDEFDFSDFPVSCCAV